MNLTMCVYCVRKKHLAVDESMEADEPRHLAIAIAICDDARAHANRSSYRVRVKQPRQPKEEYREEWRARRRLMT